MRTLICVLLAFVSTVFRSRLTLQLENVALSSWGSMSEQPSVYGFIQQIVFSGRGSRATGRIGGMLLSLCRQGR